MRKCKAESFKVHFIFVEMRKSEETSTILEEGQEFLFSQAGLDFWCMASIEKRVKLVQKWILKKFKFTKKLLHFCALKLL